MKKIAVITDDGVSVSRHFGRAQFYEIFEFSQDGRLISRERRDKLGHNHFHGQAENHVHDNGNGHGFHNQDRHMSMSNIISDCQYLVVRGMGSGAYTHLKQRGIEPIVTDVSDVQEAAKRASLGKLEHHGEILR